MTDYRRINRSVMADTKKQYTTVPELRAAKSAGRCSQSPKIEQK